MLRARAAVVMVGYDFRDPSSAHWIIKNSWGDKWGEKVRRAGWEGGAAGCPARARSCAPLQVS